jgi:hypothetical protein
MKEQEDWGWFIDPEENINYQALYFPKPSTIHKTDNHFTQSIDNVCKISIIIVVTIYVYFKFV